MVINYKKITITILILLFIPLSLLSDTKNRFSFYTRVYNLSTGDTLKERPIRIYPKCYSLYGYRLVVICNNKTKSDTTFTILNSVVKNITEANSGFVSLFGMYDNNGDGVTLDIASGKRKKLVIKIFFRIAQNQVLHDDFILEHRLRYGSNPDDFTLLHTKFIIKTNEINDTLIPRLINNSEIENVYYTPNENPLFDYNKGLSKDISFVPGNNFDY